MADLAQSLGRSMLVQQPSFLCRQRSLSPLRVRVEWALMRSLGRRGGGPSGERPGWKLDVWDIRICSYHLCGFSSSFLSCALFSHSFCNFFLGGGRVVVVECIEFFLIFDFFLFYIFLYKFTIYTFYFCSFVAMLENFISHAWQSPKLFGILTLLPLTRYMCFSTR